MIWIFYKYTNYCYLLKQTKTFYFHQKSSPLSIWYVWHLTFKFVSPPAFEWLRHFSQGEKTEDGDGPRRIMSSIFQHDIIIILKYKKQNKIHKMLL